MRLPLIALWLLATLTQAQPHSSSDWMEDVKYFKEQLPKRHKNAFHHVLQDEFNKDVDQLLSDMPALKENEVIVRIMQIAAKIGDGHTYVHVPQTFKRYPLVVNWFGDELRVTATTADYRRIVGTRLVGIEDHKLEDIRRKMSTVISQDEPIGYWISTSIAFIPIPEILAGLGIAKSDQQASFVFLDSADHEFKVQLPAMPIDPSRRWIPASKTIPLFRQQQNNPFWFTYVDDIKAVYVSFKKYDDLRKNSKDLFEFIKSKNAERLIVDLRQNGGGDYFEGRKHLIEKIKADPVLNQKGHLFVIPGHRTFSAAMVNTIDFKKETNAILVGVPPGERPNSYSENDEMKLPNSGLVLSYSTRYYKFLDQDVDAFEPDVRVEPVWSEFSAGRDPVMDWISAYCKKPAQPQN
jgi:hypothetical protein